MRDVNEHMFLLVSSTRAIIFQSPGSLDLSQAGSRQHVSPVTTGLRQVLKHLRNAGLFTDSRSGASIHLIGSLFTTCAPQMPGHRAVTVEGRIVLQSNSKETSK
jgi:hypothetical protein